MEMKTASQEVAEMLFIAPLILFFVFFVASAFDLWEADRLWREAKRNHREAIEISALKNVIEREKVLLVQYQTELKELKAIPLEVRLSMWPHSAIATCSRALHEQERIVNKYVHEWNRWQWKHNAVIMGTPEFQKMLI